MSESKQTCCERIFLHSDISWTTGFLDFFLHLMQDQKIEFVIEIESLELQKKSKHHGKLERVGNWKNHQISEWVAREITYSFDLKRGCLDSLSTGGAY